MRVLIVDDEAPARRKLRHLLAGEAEIQVVGDAANGEAAVAKVRELNPDLVLLDIQMPKLDGFGVIQQVGVEAMPMVIFITAFDQHALRAFEVHACDYLLKPFSASRLRASLQRIRHRWRERNTLKDRQQLSSLLTELAPRSYVKRIRAEKGPMRESFVTVEDILVLRAQRNDVHLVTHEGTFRRRATLSSLEAQLDPEEFVRINRSEIVRLDAISEIQPWFRGDQRLILANGETLSWSRRYRSRKAD